MTDLTGREFAYCPGEMKELSTPRPSPIMSIRDLSTVAPPPGFSSNASTVSVSTTNSGGSGSTIWGKSSTVKQWSDDLDKEKAIAQSQQAILDEIKKNNVAKNKDVIKRLRFDDEVKLFGDSEMEDVDVNGVE